MGCDVMGVTWVNTRIGAWGEEVGFWWPMRMDVVVRRDRGLELGLSIIYCFFVIAVKIVVVLSRNKHELELCHIHQSILMHLMST